MWVAFALVSALSAAGTTLMLKQAVARGGAVESTVAFRAVAGLLLAALTLAVGPWPAPTPVYWRTAALVIPPEVAGMVCLSLVQPLLGTLPLFVTIVATVLLDETPTLPAAAGIVLVTLGVYAVGLRAGASPLDPLRALVRSRAGWYALAASAAWSLATVLHKVGIREVGPFAWAVTLTLGSALALATALPVLWGTGRLRLPGRDVPWLRLVAAAGACFAVQQVGLHLSLRQARAGYVIALTATSTLAATAFGVVVLGERSAPRARVAASLLVSAGAAIIALAG